MGMRALVVLLVGWVGSEVVGSMGVEAWMGGTDGTGVKIGLLELGLGSDF